MAVSVSYPNSGVSPFLSIKGIEFEIIGYITLLQKKYPDLLVFLTGGDKFSFDTNLKSIIFADRFLVLKGLNRILNYNVK